MPPNRDSVRKMMQDTTTANGTVLHVGFEPAFIFNNATKFSVALKPSNKKFAVELTPEIYAGTHVLNHYNDKVSGFGIGLYHQLYIYEGNKHPAILSFGATYRSINVAYADEGFIPFEQNNLQYYRYKNFDDVLKTSSLLVNVYAGTRVTHNRSPVFVDFYAGFGYKFASAKATYPGFRTYSANMFDYAYKGPVLLVGMKFGPSFFLKN